MNLCKKCNTQYITIVKESGNVYVHKRVQKDKHEVVPQDEG